MSEENREYEPYQPDPTPTDRLEKRLTFLREHPRATGIAVFISLALIGLAIQAIETMTITAWGTFLALAIVTVAIIWLLIR